MGDEHIKIEILHDVGEDTDKVDEGDPSRGPSRAAAVHPDYRNAELSIKDVDIAAPLLRFVGIDGCCGVLVDARDEECVMSEPTEFLDHPLRHKLLSLGEASLI